MSNQETSTPQSSSPVQPNHVIPSSNSSWLKTFSIGFSIISFGITIAIVGYSVLTTKQNQTVNQQQVTISPTIPQPSPTLTPDETGPNTVCGSNKDCWCRAFTGAEFIPGERVEGTCNLKTNRCELCLYY